MALLVSPLLWFYPMDNDWMGVKIRLRLNSKGITHKDSSWSLADPIPHNANGLYVPGRKMNLLQFLAQYVLLLKWKSRTRKNTK